MADQIKANPERSRDKGGSSRSAHCIPPEASACSDENRRYVDVTAMIRSLQRTEGLTDCFRRGLSDCDELECSWRQYCLTGPEEAHTEK